MLPTECLSCLLMIHPNQVGGDNLFALLFWVLPHIVPTTMTDHGHIIDHPPSKRISASSYLSAALLVTERGSGALRKALAPGRGLVDVCLARKSGVLNGGK